jgi:hypothetical protein
MAKASISQLTQKAIIRARRNGEGSIAELALRFNVSEASIKRICKGVKPGASQEAVAAVVTDAIVANQPIRVGGLDVSEYIESMATDLRAEMPTARVNSKEGLAGAVLKLLQFYVELCPPTIEGIVDQLLAHPDFSMEKIGPLIRDRYAQKAS